MKKEKIKSICILRLSAIGDVTHVLPVVATLQKAFPNAEITWVIGTLEYKLMKGLPNVKFIIFDKKRGSSAYKNLKKALKGIVFDVLLHMQYSFRANRVAWKINAKKCIGFDKNRSREFHGLKLTHRIKAVNKQHVLDGFMEFVKVLGVDDFVYNWNIVVSKEDVDYAESIIDKTKINVVISPFSSNALRNWSNEKYAKIIDYIIEKYKANIILCGSPSSYEIDSSVLIENQTKYTINNTTGNDTLKQLFALMQRVDLVISPDSGPMHIANAAITPVIGLHAATTAKRSGAYNYLNLAIDCFDQAADEFMNKSSDKIRWGGQICKSGVMDLISLDDVKKMVDKVLG